ncbi:MAG TPA: SpoIIE family protein phosphatase [Intrasporangium sp.]|uniref:SpoIIE family protein phosphatase n=1 Tax=Intrasporangium sp. TaxID=1925024 RepID=UPI002D795E49|nr:SpoIIE family protein phosphatase [Intrasporangium sp.]HET7397574.1 SpoIIE family protein phosphatase [Intrasporangium sp.]
MADPDSRWETAPCGLVVLRADGTVVDGNRTFLSLLGRPRDDVVARVRFSDLLSVGGRIYWETHLSPLLLVEGRVEEIALELRGPGGRRPVLVTAELRASPAGDQEIHVAVSSATERARYEHELRAARTSAQRSAAHLRLLQEATAALSQALGVTAVADALVAAARGSLGAASATVWLADADQRLVPHRGDVAGAGEPPVEVRAGGMAVEEPDRVVIPLQGQSRLQGALVVVAREGAGDEPLDPDVLTAVGQQAGLALDRARLYEQSATVAHELQHALLDVEPPVDDRFTVAAAYRPGVEMLSIGGDWYDVFGDGDRLLHLGVGDVVGRGLTAATAMGQLRTAVRVLAGPDLGPADLLARLDGFVDRVDAAQMATLAYAELDLGTGVVRFACAGHPPPVLLPSDGPPRLLWQGRSAPLGAYLDPHVREEGHLQLAPGDRLLLYTDGLVERRDRDWDEGLHLLVAAATAAQAAPPAEAVRSLMAALLEDESARDDVCVLLLAWSGC